MGNRSSRNAEVRERERESMMPRIFYLVFGEPSIRYIHRRNRGPLIFDVTMEQDEDETKIQRAETLQLPSAIPMKQDFLLTPVVRGTTHKGYKLSFRLSVDDASDCSSSSSSSSSSSDADENDSGAAVGTAACGSHSHRRTRRQQRRQHFPKYVSVYAGVRVLYLPGKGIRLEQDKASQEEPVVLDRDTFDSVNLTTTEPILLHKLCRSSFQEPKEGQPAPVTTGGNRQLLTAPICIAARITCDGTAAADSDDDSDENSDEDSDEEQNGEHEEARGGQASRRNGWGERQYPTDADGDHPAFAATEERREGEEAADTVGERVGGGTAKKRKAHATKHGGREAAAKAAKAGASSKTRRKPFHNSSATFDVILYTFLDFPEDAYEPKRADPSVLPPAPTATTATTAAAQRSAQEAELDKQLQYKGHVVKQLLQIGAEVYEIEDIFNLGASDDASAGGGASGSGGGALVDVAGEDDDDGDICVICLTNSKDTTILPCRHMCICYECASQVRLSTNKCPICRCAIERVITI